MKQKKIDWKIIFLQVVSLLLFLSVCEYLVRTGIINQLYLAAPTRMIQVTVAFFASGTIFTPLYYTVYEYVAGFGLAILLGIFGGIVLALLPRLYKFSSPFLSALMAVPRVTLIPLLTLWLGIGFTQKITIVFIFAIFPILFNTMAGVSEANENFIRVAKVFEASKPQIIMKVLIPSAIPTIFSGLRISAASGLVGAIFGEMLASKAGLGNLLTQAVSLYNTNEIFVLITIVTVISVINIEIINVIEHKIYPKNN
ncbi:MAG: ABC transporter permease [Sporolactobacillus sp.]|jgi:NitT/TauT family transport system permease protein|nr:ABC transporter permease [Sporolactobacillus sp.]MCI1881111.1 ABC transporter permease [Sporolactobacillus sp.]